MLVGARLSCCTHLLVLPLPPASRCLAGDERDAGITSKAARAIQHPPRIKGILHAGWERRCACCVHPSTKPPGGPGCSSTGCPGGSLGQGCSLLAGVCRAGQEVCNAAGCKGWLRGESSLPLSPTCLTSTSCCPAAAGGQAGERELVTPEQNEIRQEEAAWGAGRPARCRLSLPRAGAGALQDGSHTVTGPIPVPPPSQCPSRHTSGLLEAKHGQFPA